MGGFSASYVVHSDRAEDVEGTLRQLLFDDGWKESDQSLNDEESMGLGGPRRDIIVCKPTGDWTPVIDSAALISEMPSQLSETMNTSVFNVHVHDSDFWIYSLFRRGELIDVEPSLAYLSYRYWLEDPHDQTLQEYRHLLLEEG